LWRRWRFSLGFLLAGAAVAGISVLITGVPQTRLYVETLVEIAGLRPPTNGLSFHPVNWQMMATVHGFVFTLANPWMPKRLVEGVTILLSATIMGWTFIRGRRLTDASHLLLLAIPCSVLVSHHAYRHDLSPLLLPLVVLLDSFVVRETHGGRDRLIVLAAVLMFIAPVMESYSSNHFYVVAVPVLLFLLATAAAVSSEHFRGNSSSSPNLVLPQTG
jgi:hypothetical protein